MDDWGLLSPLSAEIARAFESLTASKEEFGGKLILKLKSKFLIVSMLLWLAPQNFGELLGTTICI